MYKHLKVSLTSAQAKSAVAGKAVKVKAGQIDSGDSIIFLHPTNYKLLTKAKKNGKGATIQLSSGEIEATRMSDMTGSGIFNWLKKGWNWAKNNWDSTLKPIASAIADVGVPALATAVGAPQLAGVARSGLKDLTGVGIENKTTKKKLVKGSEEAKAHMSAIRAKRKGKKQSGAGLYI